MQGQWCMLGEQKKKVFEKGKHQVRSHLHGYFSKYNLATLTTLTSWSQTT
jgi:hypothetical protein